MTRDPSPPQPEALKALQSHVRGEILLPGDVSYAIGRRCWNASIDRRPAGIVRCKDAEDVTQTLRIATEYGFPVTVRGGGHNVAGRGIADETLLIDLSRMRGVSVHGDSSVAEVQGGALWHDVDVAAARCGLATTGGLVSSTGVGGFTLGGGAGWLMRRFGLAIDNLRAASVVLADGRFVRASTDEHPDLFWGLRGGGGGLGVVTGFEFALHPVRQVYAGVVVRRAEETALLLRTFRDFTAEAPDAFCGLVALMHAPTLPFLDAAWYGRPVAITALCWSGDLALAEDVLAPLRRVGSPIVDHVGPMPYVQWQHLQDVGAPSGRHHYWKTASYRSLPDATIETLADAALSLPTALTEIHVQHLGGAVARVSVEETAFAQRDAGTFVNLIGATQWPEEFSLMRERVRALHEHIAAGSLPRSFPNFTDRDDGRVADQLGPGTAERLQALRRRYDPAGRFAPT
ncbi:MAG TPA: FAD-binding oxidoreductase [Steroidobacteraceae bacterium]|nr:FAD-binding oxidoreductase [Steroidobacteraceae bacterium]